MAPTRTGKKKSDINTIQAYWDLDALRYKNTQMVQALKKSQQELHVFRKENMKLRQEIVSINAECSNLKAILNRIQSTAEVTLSDGIAQILHLCAIAKSVSNVKDTKTQAVSPHRVNGNLIQIPNITLSRLTGNSNRSLNDSRTSTHRHENDPDDEIPSTSTGETNQFVQVRKRSQPNGFVQNSPSKSFDFEDEEDDDTLCASPSPRDLSMSMLNIQLERSNLSHEMDEEHNNSNILNDSNGQSAVNNNILTIPLENFCQEYESEESQPNSDDDRLETIHEAEELSYTDSTNNSIQNCVFNKELRVCLNPLPDSTLNDEQTSLLNHTQNSSLVGEINNTFYDRFSSDFQNTSCNGYRNSFQHDLSRKSSSFTFNSADSNVSNATVLQKNDISDPEPQISLLRSLGLHPTINKDLLTSTPYACKTENGRKDLLTKANLSNITDFNERCSSSTLNVPSTSSSINPSNSTRDTSIEDRSPIRRKGKRSISSDQAEGPARIVRRTTRIIPELTHITVRKNRQQSTKSDTTGSSHNSDTSNSIEETIQTIEEKSETSNLSEENVITPEETIRKERRKPKKQIVVSPKKRPARKAKPTSLMEPNINRKMRRSK